ncbi:CapA family protein [Candidatus Parcubacteria bacterium]|nr:CapA family protein [Candidatus Parcubacteria bacterium]
MDDLNNNGRKSTRFRFRPPGQGPSAANPKQVKQPTQNPKRPEPLLQDGFRDLYNPSKKPVPPKKSKTKLTVKKFLAIFLVIFALAAAGGYFLIKDDSPTAPPANENMQKQPAAKPAAADKIRLIAGGDMLPHETVNLRAKTNGSYDYTQFFDQISPTFSSADIAFCNQESPSAPSLPVTAYPGFNAPEEFAGDLSKVGCNVIGLANNHLYDKGQAGIDGTRIVWDKIKPLAVAGANRSQAEQNKVSYFEVKGVKFAFAAYTETSNRRPAERFSLNILDEQLVKSQLGEADKKADVVLVSVHWGSEYKPSANTGQERWAKIFADNGADVVLGSGPHVLQPVKKIPQSGGGETIVFYSLGNLLSTQLDIESLIGGLAVLDIDAASKKIENLGFFPTYMHYEWSPAEKARQDLLARKNLKIYPLEQSAEPLAKSQHSSTVQEQTKRIRDLLNQFTAVKILKLSDF